MVKYCNVATRGELTTFKTGPHPVLTLLSALQLSYLAFIPNSIDGPNNLSAFNKEMALASLGSPD